MNAAALTKEVDALKITITGLQSEVKSLTTFVQTLAEEKHTVVAAQPAKPARANAPTKGQTMKVDGVRCGKCSKGSVEVKHPSVADVKACYGA